MGNNKIKLTDADLKKFELERQENIKNFKDQFEDFYNNDSDKKADWNFVMPLITNIEQLTDAHVYFSKESVEINYSTEKLHFNYSVYYNGQVDGKDTGKLYATLNVVHTFIRWALDNL